MLCELRKEYDVIVLVSCSSAATCSYASSYWLSADSFLLETADGTDRWLQKWNKLYCGVLYNGID